MNVDQRKFLVDRVNKTFNNQVENISRTKPTEPSLNNYLVAACLDDTIELVSVEQIKAKIKQQVLQLGASDALIKEERNYRDSKAKKTVTLKADDIFVIPAAYKKALEEYEAAYKEIADEINKLEASRDTILLKINIGSNQVLDKLVTQVDNMADLNIMNSQFLLS